MRTGGQMSVNICCVRRMSAQKKKRASSQILKSRGGGGVGEGMALLSGAGILLCKFNEIYW
jgi:hypothetical protein